MDTRKDSVSLGAILGGIFASILIGAAFGLSAGIIAGIFGGFGVMVLVCTIGIIADKVIAAISETEETGANK